MTGEVRGLDDLIPELTCAHQSSSESLMCWDNLDTLNIGYDSSHVSKSYHHRKVTLSSEVIISVLSSMS